MKHINTIKNQASTSTPQLSNHGSSSSTTRLKKLRVVSPPDDEKNNKNGVVHNGDEWTEISLNNSPDEICYNNENYSDEDEPIPYKPLPMDFSPDAVNSSTTIIDSVKTAKEEPIRKKLVTQQSLPVISKNHEIAMSIEKRDEVTRSPSMKNRTKLDSSLASWISRSSAAGEASCSSSSEYF